MPQDTAPSLNKVKLPANIEAMTDAQANAALKAQLQAMKDENDALKASTARTFKVKDSQKGAVSVYGFGRFPVTLYAPSWEQLLGTDPSKCSVTGKLILETIAVLKSKGLLRAKDEAIEVYCKRTGKALPTDKKAE